MKICLINNLYGENARGGAEKVVETIANGLKEKGHEVFVISSKSLNSSVTKIDGRQFSLPRNMADNLTREEKIREYRIFPLNLCGYENLARHGIIFRLFWHLFDIFNLHGFFVVRKILRKENPDIVWTHNLMGLGFLIPLAIKSLGIKHIHTFHDVQLSAPSGLIIKGKEKDIFGQKTYERICRFLFGSPAIVISPSKWLLDFYIEKGFFSKSKKMVLQNPIPDIGRRSVRPPYVAMTKERYSMSISRINILYLGQVEEHKGIIFAINAIKKMPENFIFHIVGSGEKLEEAKEITAGDSCFIFYGRKYGADLEEIWKKINLTIVPSLCYENSPTVIFESLSRKIPVIASNIGGIPEILPSEFLFKAGNEAEFLEKIGWFLKNKDGIEDKLTVNILNANDFVDTILEEIKK